MADYRILTDSCCDLTADMVEELNLRVLPLSFTMNGKTYKNYSDGREMDNATFYEHIKNGAMPTTSQVNPDEWESAFDEILANGADVSTMPIQYAPQFTKKVNTANAEALGITVPADYVAIE